MTLYTFVKKYCHSSYKWNFKKSRGMTYCDMYVNLLRCFPGSITLQMPQMKLGFTIDPQQHWWPNNQQQKNVLRREGRLLTEAKAWNLGRKLGKKKTS